MCEDMHAPAHEKSANVSISELSARPWEEGEHHYPSSIFKAMGREGVQSRAGDGAHWLVAEEEEEVEEEEMTAWRRSRSEEETRHQKRLNIVTFGKNHSCEVTVAHFSIFFSLYLNVQADMHHLVCSQRGSG